MIPTTVREIAELTGGRLADGLDETAMVTGDVVIDSRRAGPGSLFVCLPGESADGHDFAAAALDAGAVAALAAREVGVPAVIVARPQDALAALAAGMLRRTDCRVVGVTGSSGKTSTKDLLAAVFRRVGPTVAPEESFNNELGLPLTVLRVDEQTRTLVCEYSARGTGHIRSLCEIAPPSIGVVLNVGSAHLGEFGSRQAIATAKGELVEALPASGTAVLNADDELVIGMRTRTGADVLTFGRAAGADVRLLDVVLDHAARPRISLRTPAGDVEIQLAVAGAHQAGNAAAVVAAGLAAGLELPVVADVLSTASITSKHRMAVHHRRDGVTVIDDAYNANPESMTAALDALAALAGDRPTWAVLGEMREMGDRSADLHRAVGAHAARTGVDQLVVVGDCEAIAAGAAGVDGWQGQVRRVHDVDEATQLVASHVVAPAVVLVKASNSIRLWRVAESLVAELPAEAHG